MANELAEKKGTAVADVYDYGQDAREGFEDISVNDISIPFLNLLQSNSPEVEEQTIPGAVAGAVMNSVTREIMTLPVVFQPIYREQVWVNWRPRREGGGVISRHAPDDQIVLDVIARNGGSRIPPQGDDKKRIPFKGPEGGELVETYYIYGFILDEAGESIDGYGVLSFSSTKIKVQKDWVSAMFTVKGQPPLFAHRAKISTSREKREGGSFFNFAISPFAATWRESLINPSTPVGQNLLTEAKSFREMIMSGLARADTSGMKADGDTIEGSAESNPGGKGRTRGKVADDDEIPF